MKKTIIAVTLLLLTAVSIPLISASKTSADEEATVAKSSSNTGFINIGEDGVQINSDLFSLSVGANGVQIIDGDKKIIDEIINAGGKGLNEIIKERSESKRLSSTIRTNNQKQNIYTQLTGKKFNHTKLVGDDLSGRDFSNSEFSHTDISNVNFSGANLSGAEFGFGDISNVNFTDANLSGAIFTQGSVSNVNFTGANLSGATFSLGDITFTDMSNAIMTDVCFKRYDISNSKMMNVDLSGSAISSTNFIKVDLTGAKRDYILPKGSDCGDIKR